MKSPLFIVTLCLFYTFATAQIQDLSNLASGWFIDFGMLFNNYDPDDTCYICDDKADVFGYYSLYNNGEVKENIYEIEYVLFDKNLNKFSNGTFNILKSPKKTDSYLNLYKKQDTLLIVNRLKSLSTFEYGNNMYIYQKLSLKDNKLLPPYYYEKSAKKVLDIDDIASDFSRKKLRILNRETEWTKEQKDSARTRKTLFSYNEEKTKLLLNLKKRKPKRRLSSEYEESIELINNEHQIWKTQLPKPEKSKYYYDYNNLFLDKESKNIGISVYSNKDNYREIQFYNLDTGELKFRSTPFNNNKVYSYRNNYNLNNNTISIASKLIKKYLRGFYFYRYNIDTQKELINKEFFWKDASKFIKISKKGGVERRYSLKLLNFIFLKNSNVGILAEKSKIRSYKYGEQEVTSDFVFFMFDKNLELTDVKTIEKDKTVSANRNSDYLFSQGVEGGALIYYKDYQKEKGARKRKWFLGIISYVDGKFGHQKIPMSSEDYSIKPYPAKEGYILLREFNTSNDKYNKIRLEKINY